MNLPAHIFREYDIRGVVETDLTPDVVEALGRGLGTVFVRDGRTAVGVARDVRESGARIFDDLSRGLLKAGCDVVDYGQAPTPAFYHGVVVGPEHAGVCITGSHNPPEFNGFKILEGDMSFFGDAIRALRDMIEAGDFETGEGRLSQRDVIGPYVDELIQKTDLARPVRFAYDSGNGAASLVASRVFEGLGLSPVALFDTPDGSFPNHHPDPTLPENLEDLRRSVLEGGLELGIAYDGDADRIGVIDDAGDVLWGDRLLMIYSRDLLLRHPGTPVIFDVKCSQTLIDDIANHGGEPVIWKTGHSLVKQKMKDTGALLAGEMSGHMFFGENWYGFDDAILATLRLLEIVSRDERPLSQQLADVPVLVATPEIRVDCDDHLKFDVVERVKASLAAEYSILDIDGVRVLFPDGWGLVRASNTQPALVVRVEASDEAHVSEYHALIESEIAQARSGLADGG